MQNVTEPRKVLPRLPHCPCTWKSLVYEDTGCWPVLSYSGLKVCVLGLEGHQSHLVLICPTMVQSPWAYSRMGCCPLSPGVLHASNKVVISSREETLAKSPTGRQYLVLKSVLHMLTGLLIQIIGSKSPRKSPYWCALADNTVSENTAGNDQTLKSNRELPLECVPVLGEGIRVDRARQG